MISSVQILIVFRWHKHDFDMRESLTFVWMNRLLARILVACQFPRHPFRSTPRADGVEEELFLTRYAFVKGQSYIIIALSQ